MMPHQLQFYDGIRLTPVLQWCQTNTSFTMVLDRLQLYSGARLTPVLWCPADPSVMMVSVWLQCYDVQLIPVLWCPAKPIVMMVSVWLQCCDVQLIPVLWCPADPSVMMVCRQNSCWWATWCITWRRSHASRHRTLHGSTSPARYVPFSFIVAHPLHAIPFTDTQLYHLPWFNNENND